MGNVGGRAHRRLVLLIVLPVTFFSILYVGLPLDSPLRLAVSFNAARVTNSVLQTVSDNDAWLHTPPIDSLDLSTEVGYLIKTGYGTRHRVPLQLEAYRGSGDILGEEGNNFIVVGDWTTVNETDAKVIGVPVHDALKVLWDKDYLRGRRQHVRFRKYKSLQTAIRAGDESQALEIGQKVGWELDVLKVMMHRILLLEEDTRS